VDLCVIVMIIAVMMTFKMINHDVSYVRPLWRSHMHVSFQVTTLIFLDILRGADSRVVKSLDCGATGPEFESRCRRKVLAVMELFVNIYPMSLS